MTVDFDSFRDWLRTGAAEPIAAKLVPGASTVERQRLAALGGLVRQLVPPSERTSWPSDVVDWLSCGPTAPDEIVFAARHAIADDPDKSLAALYGELVSNVSRRALGTFFTPSPEVKLMVDMWEHFEEAPSTVVDVGAGVGVFTISAAERWPEAHVFGVDINPVTLGLLALRVWLSPLPSASVSGSTSGISLIRDDFTTWMVDSWSDTETPRLILGNPPYTRWQLLSTEDRVRLRKAANGLCGSRASLSTLITAISLHHLGRSDGLCLLLPAQWLESQYAVPLRNYLAGLTRRRVEVRLVESQLFPDAEVDAVALLVGRERDEEQPFCIAMLTPDDEATPVDRTRLVDKQWRQLFNSRSSKPLALDLLQPHSSTNSKLSDYSVVRRGIATGANSFFVMSDHDAIRNQIPSDCLLRLVRRLNHYPDVIDDHAFNMAGGDEKRWLLHVTRVRRSEDNAVDQYLKIGEATGIAARYLCRERKSAWYDLTHDLFTPDVIISPMTRGRVSFVENQVGAVITNNLYGWRWLPAVASVTRTAIIDWLRSDTGQTTVLAAARQQGAGLRKIEPSDLAKIVIPSSIARSSSQTLDEFWLDDSQESLYVSQTSGTDTKRRGD
jgi:predicted RNA methylase